MIILRREFLGELYEYYKPILNNKRVEGDIFFEPSKETEKLMLAGILGYLEATDKSPRDNNFNSPIDNNFKLEEEEL